MLWKDIHVYSKVKVQMEKANYLTFRLCNLDKEFGNKLFERVSVCTYISIDKVVMKNVKQL